MKGEINLIERDNGGAFVYEKQGEKGEMTFSKAGTTMLIIDHTEVDEVLRGMGIGERLLDELVSYARKNELRVIPLCPFAKSVFEKKAEIRDVLK